MSYQIYGIDSTPFEHLFGLDAKELQQLGAKRFIVDAVNSYPDRVSVSDLSIGESALLVNFEHLCVEGPYASRHAIFVAERPAKAAVFVDQIPGALQRRLLSVRSFDGENMMLDAEALDGSSLEGWIQSAFEKNEVQYIHVHTARRGCFLATVKRSGVVA